MWNWTDIYLSVRQDNHDRNSVPVEQRAGGLEILIFGGFDSELNNVMTC